MAFNPEKPPLPYEHPPVGDYRCPRLPPSPPPYLPPQPTLPSNFTCKKYTIVTLTTIRIVVVIIAVAVVCAMSDRFLEHSQIHLQGEGSKSDLWISQSTLIAILVLFGMVDVCFSLIGLIGALKHHYCLCVAYAVLNVLSLFGSLIQAFRSPTMWTAPIFPLILTVVTFQFIRDLSQIAHQQQQIVTMNRPMYQI